MALAADGRFLYISETVSIYLGLSQVSKTIHLRRHVHVFTVDLCARSEGGRFEEATKVFLCALCIYFVCTCILNEKIGRAHLEKLIQLQKHYNFHEISNLFPYFVGKFMEVFDKYSDCPELKHTLQCEQDAPKQTKNHNNYCVHLYIVCCSVDGIEYTHTHVAFHTYSTHTKAFETAQTACIVHSS